ncbi:MAG: selenium cofactor biosynthesis protein YqeC [Nitrospinota bacterium]
MEGAGNLIDRLGITLGSVVALCGSGGKTTFLYRMATAAADRGWNVLCSSTVAAQMAPAAPGRAVVVAGGLPDLEAHLRETFTASGQVVLYGSVERRDKLLGMPVETLGALYEAGLADLFLLECCGARGRSFKAPAPHEPVIPPFATHVVVVVGMEVVGRPMDERLVHRPERITALMGLPMGGIISPEVIAHVVGAPESYLSKGPSGAPWFLYCAKATSPERQKAAARLAELLRESPFQVIFAD